MLKYVLVTLYGVVVFIVFYAAEQHYSIKAFTLNQDANLSILTPILVTISLFLGIITRVLHGELIMQKDDISILSILGNLPKKKSFWISAIFSPVVLLAFYKTFVDTGSQLLMVLSAYQNGFFFNAVLSKGDK